MLSCMAYVDLNPVRACMAEDAITSDFTSIQQRLYDYAQQAPRKTATEQQLIKRVEAQQSIKKELHLHNLPSAALMRFDGSSTTDIHSALPFTQEDYFTLVDVTGRSIRDDKKGHIFVQLAPILQRLGVQSKQWIHQVQHFGKSYGCCAGSANNIVEFAAKFERRWGGV